jgi:hypothetical protein
MSYLAESCSTNAGNTGLQTCTGSLARDERIWLVPSGTEIDTKTLAETESTWDDIFNAAKGSRGYPLPTIFNAEFEQGEDTYEEGWDNKQDFASEGLDQVTYTLDRISLYNAKELRKLNGIDWAAFRVTSEGEIIGYSNDGIKFKPEDILSFRVGKRTNANGEQVERVPITIVWKTPAQRNDFPAVVKPLDATPSWNPLEIDGIKDLQVSASNPAITGVTLTLTGFDSVPHEGAVTGDFIILDSTGTEVTVTGATESSPGVYDLTATLVSAQTYTGGLQNAENATTKYFETPILAEFTIP